MKIKNAVIIEYNDKDKECIVHNGTDVFHIQDNEKNYYAKLTGNRDAIENIRDLELIDFLKNNNLVILDYNMKDVSSELAKNLFYFESIVKDHSTSPVDIQKDLSNRKIAILGCGGVGTVVLQNLVLIGIRNFILIDGDYVNEDNLNRQLFFSRDDIGEKKTTCLKKRLKLMFDDIHISSYEMFINDSKNLKRILDEEKIDFLINCADTPNNLSSIVANSCNYITPFIAGGVGIETAHWGPIYDGKNKWKIASCEKTEKSYTLEGSISFTNMITATYMVKDVITYLITKDMNKKTNLYREKIINFEKDTIEVI